MSQARTSDQTQRIPVSIITGFLGSGKTTLLRDLISQPGMESIALIINEFGEVGLDNLLVETAIENTLLLENGCICCSVRGDLIDTINDLFAKVRTNIIPNFSRIVIETTGLAEPGPIVNTISTERVLVSRCRLDNVVTLIDGVQGKMQALTYPEAIKQIAQADIGLITKRDLISVADASGLAAFAAEVNPAIRLEEVEHGHVSPDMIFGQFDNHGDMSFAPVSEEGPAHRHNDHSHEFSNEHQHGDVVTWSFVGRASLNRDRLFAWLQMLYSLRASHMLRLKGLVRLEGYTDPILLQMVGPVLGNPQLLTEWPGGEEKTRLVLIAKGLSMSDLRDSFERHVLAPA